MIDYVNRSSMAGGFLLGEESRQDLCGQSDKSEGREAEGGKDAERHNRRMRLLAELGLRLRPADGKDADADVA